MEHWDRLRGDQGFYWDDGLFRPSTDTFLLGSFPVLRRGEQVCDLGAGTGLLGALLLTREPSLTITGLELQEDACRLARRTAQRRNFQTGIVGETVGTASRMDITHLLERIALDGGLRLGNLCGNPRLGSGHELERRPQHGLHLLNLVPVVSGENYLHFI